MSKALEADILSTSERFEETDGFRDFTCNVIIYLLHSALHFALWKKRYRSKADVKLRDLYDRTLIQCFHRAPPHPTRVSDPPPSACYVKFASLMGSDPGDPAGISEQVLQEADTREILTDHLHPNIARHHGCRVQGNRIIGLCFDTYGQSLMGRVNPGSHTKPRFDASEGLWPTSRLSSKASALVLTTCIPRALFTTTSIQAISCSL